MQFLLLYSLIFCFGASLASGLFLCAQRLCDNQSVIFPRSHCSTCQHTLAWWQLLPVLNYPLLHGHCYYCNATIPITAWVAEIIGGCLGLFTWLTTTSNQQLLTTSILFAGLFLFSWIDIRQQLLFPILFIPWLLLMILLNPTTLFFSDAIFFAAGLGLFAYYSHGLGSGDVALLASLTLLHGVAASSHILLFGCLLALIGYPVFKHRRLPFIPYLSCGVWLYYLI